MKSWNYSNNGGYFITICTDKRKHILSKICVGDGFPVPQLTKKGQIVDDYIKNINLKYSCVTVSEYVVMPNHVHLLLSVVKDDGRGDPSPTVDTAMGWLKYQITKEINKVRNTKGEKIFQRSFHDHIVRNYDDYCEIRKYIHDNPIRWKYDKLYIDDSKEGETHE